MVKVNNYTFEAFKNAIQNELGPNCNSYFENNTQSVNSIFYDAATNDGGRDDTKFESSEKEFKQLVQRGINRIKEIIRQNLEREGDELWDMDVFDKVKSESSGTSTPAKVNSLPKERNVVSMRNEDGTSYLINTDSHTITKYDSNGKPVQQRKMTQQECNLSTQELINQLQKNAASQKSDESPAELLPATLRTIAGYGVKGAYSFSETEDGGYELKQQITVNAFDNQAAKAFRNGCNGDNDIFSKVKPDANGYYNFRGISAKTYNVLSSLVIARSQLIAGYTAIYMDLQTRQNKGETLNSGEEKFMTDYNTLLLQSGLQMNGNGELEDIPQKSR